MHSIIVPIYNDQEVGPLFYQRIKAVFDKLGEKFEIIFVDDASTDNTLKELKELHEKDPSVKILRMSRNFGHQVSILAGMDYASGETMITMDADLQHPPELLPRLIELYREGNEIVYTTRQDNPYTSFSARIYSNVFYKVFNAITHLGIDPGVADFRLMSRRAADQFRQLRELHRFNRGMVSWLGFKQVAVPYSAAERAAGKSKFHFMKRIRLALDGLLSFSVLPLRMACFVGVAMALLSLGYGGWVIVSKLIGRPWPAGVPTLVVGMMFFGGVQLFFIGIIGEYIGRIYNETKKRPLYVPDLELGLNGKVHEKK